MTQLNTTTVDHLLLGKLMPSIKHLYIVDSSRVKNILMPANNNVERLIITNTPLTAIVFEENAALSWLTMVETELNHIPASLGRLSNLLHFKLNQSPMRHFDLDIFCNFQKLETIDLEYNRIESVISREYFHECCKSLQHINFKHNALKRIDVNMLAPYSKLQDVYFANNLIASLTGRLKHILMFSVTLNDNSLKTLDLCEWGPLSKMITFYVRRNNLIEIPKCLNQLQNLEIIVDHLLLGELTTSVTHLHIVNSSCVKNIVMPANNNVERLTITNTPLSAIEFEENAALSWLMLEEADLNHIPATLSTIFF
ncbi:prolargin-like [Anopheles nili]|uniref:prolargin-like n=1 Tax=Anopheles nili TaxID=185578 RepID=UPI00237B9421|nr:prolargin-like [Anopheles nili]